MSENDHPIAELILLILLFIGSIAAIWEINALFGVYLNAPLWLMILVGMGIADIGIWLKLT
jgi:hypothetical protein